MLLSAAGVAEAEIWHARLKFTVIDVISIDERTMDARRFDDISGYFRMRYMLHDDYRRTQTMTDGTSRYLLPLYA